MDFQSNVQEKQMFTEQSINIAAVQQYLAEHIKDFPNEPLKVEQFSTGLSNLTFLIHSGNWEAVLRRPPNGPLPPNAHNMKRESDLLEKLHPYFPYVPKPYVFCADDNVLGVPFYVMERKRGIVLDDTFPPNQEVSKEQLEKLSYAVVDTLAELHQVNYKEAGLSEFGNAEGFLERQVHGWIKRYKKVETEANPYFEKVSKWLVNNIPSHSESAIIHNDYKLNNMLLTPDLTGITAVLDWEIATIGDPIFDLAGALAYWLQEDDPEDLKASLPSITTTPGFISRNAFLNQYELKTKKSIPALNFYIALNYFKLGVALQQIFYRWKIGQSTDERSENMDQRVKSLLKNSYEVIHKKI